MLHSSHKVMGAAQGYLMLHFYIRDVVIHTEPRLAPEFVTVRRLDRGFCPSQRFAGPAPHQILTAGIQEPYSRKHVRRGVREPDFIQATTVDESFSFQHEGTAVRSAGI